MRRNLNPEPLPNQRVVVQFLYRDLPKSKRDWWLVVEPDGEVDLCWSEPGFEVDLYVSSDLKTMTAIWMGLQTVRESGVAIKLDGSRKLQSTMQTWLGLSPFAAEKKQVSQAEVSTNPESVQTVINCQNRSVRSPSMAH